MIAALKLIPAWAWAVAALVIALLLGIGAQTYRLSLEQTAHARTEKDFSDYRGKIAEAAQKAESDARAEEARRQAAIDKVREDAQQQAKTLAADADAARTAAGGLQQRVNQLLGDRAALNARVAERGATIDRLTPLLAQLRQEADDYAGGLARALESSRIAGFACEKSYDAIRAKTNFTGSNSKWQENP